MDRLALPFEIKQLDAIGHVEGVAAVFGNVDLGGDRIIAGAFAKSLAALGSRPLPMLLHHDQTRPIGAWHEVRETAYGLAVKGRVTLASRDGAEAYALAKDGALTGLSIGYLPVRHSYDKQQVRELHEVSLHETSLVAIPMNDEARLSAVKALASVNDLRELLQLRGFSGREAKAMAGAAWKARNQHEQHDAAADEELAALFSQSVARLATI